VGEPLEPPNRFAAVSDLRAFEFDDEAIVFDPVAWDTHLLNASAIAVLDLLVEAPRSEADVARFLQDVLRPEERANAADFSSRLIRELSSLGLVRAVEPSPRANR